MKIQSRDNEMMVSIIQISRKKHKMKIVQKCDNARKSLHKYLNPRVNKYNMPT